MRRLLISLALLPLILAFPAAASTSVPQLPTGSACHTSPATRPGTIVLSCADHNMYVGAISWTLFSSVAAGGHGTFKRNTCKPTCAAGTFVSTRVSVWASSPKVVAGQLLYTHLVLASPGVHTTFTFNWTVTTYDATVTTDTTPAHLGSWTSTTTGFVAAFFPAAHRASLWALLGTKAVAGSRLTALTFATSPLNPTWIFYRVDLATSSGADAAAGYAHFTAQHWVDVFGPASGFCAHPVPGVPADVRASLPAC